VAQVSHVLDALPITQALTESQNTESNQWPSLILSSSICGLLKKAAFTIASILIY